LRPACQGALAARPGAQEPLRGNPRYDVVLTTYPLLWRDADELMQHSYHLLILDEAQTVKNAQPGAEAVRKIDARHRLCLTGTPLENHLGELWSQFDFLLPGFLGTTTASSPSTGGRRSKSRATAAPRIAGPAHSPLHPAPQEGRRRAGTAAEDHHRAQCRTRRRAARPLRNRACGDGRQGARRNRQQGFNRSQIVILDALLKLRQVCCDPRLVKAASASKVKERAKLDLLDGDAAGTGRGRPQDSALLAIHQHAGADRARTGQTGLDYVTLTGDTTTAKCRSAASRKAKCRSS
jgi:hypothetical protein